MEQKKPRPESLRIRAVSFSHQLTSRISMNSLPPVFPQKINRIDSGSLPFSATLLWTVLHSPAQFAHEDRIKIFRKTVRFAAKYSNTVTWKTVQHRNTQAKSGKTGFAGKGKLEKYDSYACMDA